MNYSSNYERFEKLGDGSFATVYRARNKTTGEVVALKQTKNMNGGDEKILGQIRKECQIIKGLNHANIVQLKDFIMTPKGGGVIVLQLCQYGDLNLFYSNYLSGKVSLAGLMAIFRQLIEPLVYLHSNSIAHRDLKLANILVDSKFNMKISDFGLAKQFDEFDALKTLCGTPITMAPQVKNQTKQAPLEYSDKVDVWSLGIIFYYLLYEKYPYSGMNTSIEAYKQPLEFPEGKLRFQVPLCLKQLLSQMIEFYPQQRLSIKEVSSSFMKMGLREDPHQISRLYKQGYEKQNLQSVAMETNSFPNNPQPTAIPSHRINHQGDYMILQQPQTQLYGLSSQQMAKMICSRLLNDCVKPVVEQWANSLEKYKTVLENLKNFESPFDFKQFILLFQQVHYMVYHLMLEQPLKFQILGKKQSLPLQKIQFFAFLLKRGYRRFQTIQLTDNLVVTTVRKLLQLLIKITNRQEELADDKVMDLYTILRQAAELMQLQKILRKCSARVNIFKGSQTGAVIRKHMQQHSKLIESKIRQWDGEDSPENMIFDYMYFQTKVDNSEQAKQIIVIESELEQIIHQLNTRINFIKDKPIKQVSVI